MDNQKLVNNREQSKEILTTPPKEMTLDEVADVLSLTIKNDDSNKKIVFLAMLSAYTEQSQINVTLNAPSATGKTYLATEIAKLFPKEDRVERSGASPTSFFYGEGVVNKVRKAKIVSLSRKILIFFEQPDPALQTRLRALLSHDSKEIIHSLTNRNKGTNRTEKIILEGFAATIFCSSNMRLDEQETTRAILLSPEATEEKIRHAIEERIKRGKNEIKYTDWLEAQPQRIELMNRIEAIRDERVDEIIITDTDAAAIEKRFLNMINKPKPSNQRDIDHLLQLIKVITLLNVWHRRQSDGSIVANQKDIDTAFKLWCDYFESQNLGIPPAVLSFYKKYIVPAYINKLKQANADEQIAMIANELGLTSQELSAYYINEEGSVINNDQLRKQIIPQLQSAGLVDVEKPKIKDSNTDRRTRHIFPKLLTDEDKKNIGIGGVGDSGSDDMSEDYNKLIAML
ncbi:hypothetical protein KC968_04290 [Candidatus Saccharibacteria bacterium]|nr:hypothetical protein [Candidatus Saccharibacteria bacterium]